MQKVILDTSFILTAIKCKIDILAELTRILDEKFSIFYIDKSMNELANKPAGKLALALLKNMKASPIETNVDKNVDSLLIDYAEAHPNDIIATQDRALKEKLKKRNTRLITIRQKTHLMRVN